MADIFISYRREDSADICDIIQDRLMWRFGQKRVFRDVTGIMAGSNFVETLNRQMMECGIVLVVIGPRWLDIRDNQGQRRLDNPQDFVRREIASALREGKKIIPIFVGGANLLSPANLPQDIAALATLRPLILRPYAWFDADFTLLQQIVAQTLRRSVASWFVLSGSAALLVSTLYIFINFALTHAIFQRGSLGILEVLVFTLLGGYGIIIAGIYSPILAIIWRNWLWVGLLVASDAIYIAGLIAVISSQSLGFSALFIIGYLSLFGSVITFGLFGRPLPVTKRTVR